MQAIKDKLSDISTMRKAKTEARAEEKAEKEYAKARVDVAREVRMAKEAEAAMELHVAKAGQRAQQELAKHAEEADQNPHDGHTDAIGGPTGPSDSFAGGAPTSRPNDATPTPHFL